MNTLANVGANSNCLWWALNCVSLLFACSKCGTTVRESPYTDMILFCDLLQSDFFARCGTILGVAKGFLWRVEKLGKR